MIRIRIGSRYLQYVDEERVLFTEKAEEAAVYTEEGALLAHEMIKKHLGAQETSH